MKLVNDNLIKKWEELRLEAYLPTPKDVMTIGWGHTKGVKRGDKITVEQAQKFFDEDTAWAQDAVNKYVKVPMTQNQFDSLVSLTFNIGAEGFRTSTVVKRINAGNYEGAAEAMTWWNKQKGKTLRGLVRRRAQEAEIFLSPDEAAPSKNIPVEIPANNIVKPITTSKEVIGGVGALLTGVAAQVGVDVPGMEGASSGPLSWALIGVGAFFLANRLYARYKGER